MSTHANRRQPVAQGGLFSSPKANFSRETQELLKGNYHSSSLEACKLDALLHAAVMMQESKLTSFQQRQLNQTLHSKTFVHLHYNVILL